MLKLVSANYDLRKMAEALQDKIADFTQRINRLSQRIGELKTEKTA